MYFNVSVVKSKTFIMLAVIDFHFGTHNLKHSISLKPQILHPVKNFPSYQLPTPCRHYPVFCFIKFTTYFM